MSYQNTIKIKKILCNIDQTTVLWKSATYTHAVVNRDLFRCETGVNMTNENTSKILLQLQRMVFSRRECLRWPQEIDRFDSRRVYWGSSWISGLSWMCQSGWSRISSRTMDHEKEIPTMTKCHLFSSRGT